MRKCIEFFRPKTSLVGCICSYMHLGKMAHHSNSSLNVIEDLLPRCKLNCPSSKWNHAPAQKFERPNGKKTQNPKFFEIGPEFVPPFSLESSMNRILRRFESNQNESKRIKTNENQWRFWTSKVYSAAILSRIFHL